MCAHAQPISYCGSSAGWSQVGGVVIKPVAGHALVEAAVRVGVVEASQRVDSVHVLLDLGRGFYIRAFSVRGFSSGCDWGRIDGAGVA